MVALRAFTGVATLAALVQVAIGAGFTVGGPNGAWDLSTNLPAWAAANKFTVGDSLAFEYAPFHDVLEVSKADYDACATSKPMSTYTGGSTVVKLSSPGKRYFICGIPGHCSQGMKVEIDAVAAAAATPPKAAASPLPLPSPPTEAPTPSKPSKAAAPSKAPSSSPAAASPLPLSSPPTEAPASPKPSKAAAPSKAPSSSPATIPPSSEPSSSDLPATTSPASPPGSAANGLGRNAKVAMGFGMGMLFLLAL